MRYLFYDVETPNKHNDRVCAVGWALVEDDAVTRSGYQLIFPNTEFDPFNIRLTGIRPEDVRTAPALSKYWESTLGELMTSSTVVAHSAGFDISATRKALEAEGVDMPLIRVIDTQQVIAAFRNGLSCRLRDVAYDLGIVYDEHNAGADARTLADVCLKLKEQRGFPSLEAMFAVKCPVRAISTRTHTDAKYISPYDRYRALVDQVRKTAAEKTVDLTDIHFAFHGEAEEPSIQRKDLVEIVESLGGECHESVTMKTDYYVCFNRNPSGSYEKGLKRVEQSGGLIHVIDGNAFFALLGLFSEPDRGGPEAIRARKRAEREAAVQAALEAEAERQMKAERIARRKAEREEAVETKPAGRPVIQLDRSTGAVVAEYPSVTLAAASLGVSTKVIRDAAIGKQRTAGGYCWRYAEEQS